MKWLTKIAHGDTLHGELRNKILSEVSKNLRALISEATLGGANSVLPRWRGEVRRAILLLPPEEKLPDMSMMELREIEGQIQSIQDTMHRYSVQRFREIVGG